MATAQRFSLRTLGTLGALVPYALRYRGRMLAALVALIAASMATLSLPVAVRYVVDHGFSAEGSGTIHLTFLGLMGAAAALAAASSMRYYLVMTLGERIVADLRAAVFDRLTRLEASFYDTAKSGELVSRLTSDTTFIKAAFGSSASVALRNGVLFLGAVVMMVITSPRLSAMVLLAIPVIVGPLVLSGRRVRARSRAAQDRLADASAYASETVGAMRIVQAFGMEGSVAGRFAVAAEEAYAAARASLRSRALLTAGALLLISLSVIGVLWYGAQDVLSGRLTGGTLSQFILYAVFAGSALGQLSEVYGELSQAAGAAERIGELLVLEPAIATPAQAQAFPEPFQARIDFDGVSFAYPGRPDAATLHEVSFGIEAGHRVAIVGPSGAGKTTLFQLLLRFYDPQGGSIRVSGVDVRQADLRELRGRMASVPQDPVIFSGSVADNIRFGSEGASLDAVKEAATLAAADEFIESLPQGYDTPLGERGVTLSGGQRQRLAIARALLKNAPILLLDEATSALDAQSEHAVQEALERLMVGRTTLVIAHRLATVLTADRILVMDRGRIVEEGTHEELISRGGLYARLAALQFQ